MDMNLPWSMIAIDQPEKVHASEHSTDQMGHAKGKLLAQRDNSAGFPNARDRVVECCARLVITIG